MALTCGKLDECRRRIQRAITDRRGRASDRLYRARRTLHTGAGLLTEAQARRLENLFADDRHAAVQAAWGVYQRLIQAYRTEDPGLGKYLMQRLIDSLKQAIPDELEEIQALARTLTSRSQDILAYFDQPRTSNGPTPGDQRAPGASTRHRPGIPQPGQLHHPQPHPHRTPQRPPDNNHLNQPISPTYHTPKHEEPVMLVMACALIPLSACHSKGATAPSPSTPTATPLDVPDLCGVTSTERLKQIFDYDLYWYSYQTGTGYSEGLGVHGHTYNCQLRSNRKPYRDINLVYNPDARVSFPELGGQIYFDEIPAKYPNASALTFENHQGSGWGWFVRSGYYMAWRYDDGSVLFARVTMNRDANEKQRQDLQEFFTEVMGTIPQVAAQEPAANTRDGQFI